MGYFLKLHRYAKMFCRHYVDIFKTYFYTFLKKRLLNRYLNIDCYIQDF